MSSIRQNFDDAAEVTHVLCVVMLCFSTKCGRRRRRMQAALNEQINMELYASYAYQVMI